MSEDRDLLGFEDVEPLIFAMALEDIAGLINAPGFAHDGRCHSNACAIGKSMERRVKCQTIETHWRTRVFKVVCVGWCYWFGQCQGNPQDI